MNDELMTFRKNALLSNLCSEWNGMWMSCHNDKEKLVRLVLMCQSAPYFATYCYLGKGLSKEYCKKEFGDYINGRVYHDCDDVSGFTYQMFVDMKTPVELRSDVSQFLWCNDLAVTIPQSKCPRLYVSNQSTLHLTLEGYSCPHVYLFDESKLVIDDADEESVVVVFKYSKNAGVEVGKYCLAQIKEFDKELRI